MLLLLLPITQFFDSSMHWHNNLSSNISLNLSRQDATLLIRVFSKHYLCDLNIKYNVSCAEMSWEVRLTPWSIVVSVLSLMCNLLYSHLSCRCPSISFVLLTWRDRVGLIAHDVRWSGNQPSLGKNMHPFPTLSHGEVEGQDFVPRLLSKPIYGETLAIWCSEAIGEAIFR